MAIAREGEKRKNENVVKARAKRKAYARQNYDTLPSLEHPETVFLTEREAFLIGKQKRHTEKAQGIADDFSLPCFLFRAFSRRDP